MIVLTCQCGVTIFELEHNIGRKVKCAGCNREITVRKKIFPTDQDDLFPNLIENTNNTRLTILIKVGQATWKYKSLLLIPVWVSFFALCLSTYAEAGKHLTPYSVEVSGYTRRDGTYVRPYQRRPPGGAQHDKPYEEKRTLCFLGMVISFVFIIIHLRSIILLLQNRTKWRR
jgi:hypothetical protein